jgi:pyridoxal phosphate enzyme (YggS family)
MNSVVKTIQETVKQHGLVQSIKIVAVSKTKPIEEIFKIYSLGHVSFGENYMDEICEKASKLPLDIQWHFIGRLQNPSTKSLTHLLSIPNLYQFETIDDVKVVNKMHKILLELKRETPLRVLIQVNTSKEDQKGGVSPLDVIPLIQHIQKCNTLDFKGLMTIGSPEHVQGRNPDFDVLMECSKRVEKEMGIRCELSMGMSADYVQAIIQGSTEVRIGSLLFKTIEHVQ